MNKILHTSKFFLFLIPSLTFLSIFDLLGSNYSSHPYLFQSLVQNAEVQMWHAADINYDGSEEFIVKVPQTGAVCAIRVYSNDLHIIFYQKNFQKQITSISTFNWDHSGFKEILLIEKDFHWINLLLLNALNAEDTLNFMQLVSVEEFGPNIEAKYPLFLDINQDGYKDVILSIGSGLQPKLRAVWAVDLKNKSVLWKFALAPNVYEKLDLQKFSNQHNPSLFISTISPDNGYSINQMDDSHSYSLVLDAVTGECLFKKELGTAYSATRTILFNQHPSGREVIVTITCNQSFKEWDKGKIIIWDWQNQSIKKKLENLQTEEHWIHVADVNNDGKQELVRSGADNRILIYDSNLSPIDTLILPYNKINIAKIEDLNNDGFIEYIAFANQEQTLVINHKGEILAETKFYGEVSPFHIKASQSMGLVLYDKKNKILKTINIQQNFAPMKEKSKSLVIVLLVSGLTTFLIFTVFYFKFKNSLLFPQSISVLENIPFPFLVADERRKVVFCSQSFQNLLGLNKTQILQKSISIIFDLLGISLKTNLIKNKEIILEQNFKYEFKVDDRIKNIKLKLSQLKNRGNLIGYLLVAEDITDSEHYQKSISWAAMAQRLAHEIKNPLTTVKLSLQRLKMAYEKEPDEKRAIYAKYVDSSLEEIIRLRKVAENFMKFCRIERPTFKNVQLNEMIESLVSKHQIVLPAEQIIDFAPEKELPEIKGDIDQLETAVNNLIDNAVKATHPKGRIELRTYHIKKINNTGSDEFVLLEIEDTGVGIPSDKLEKIFQPYVSGELNGTGLGLAIVQRIINDHHGRITIKSRESAGTLVSIELPLSNPKIQVRG